MSRSLRYSGLAALLLVLAVLSACGFHLRGSSSAEMPFASLSIEDTGAERMGAELRGKLSAQGRVSVTSGAAAQARLILSNERQEREAVSYNASGLVREFLLRLSVEFELRNRAGQILIEKTPLSAQRSISFSESAALSKESEMDVIYQDMRKGLLRQLLLRLSRAQGLSAAKPAAAKKP